MSINWRDVVLPLVASVRHWRWETTPQMVLSSFSSVPPLLNASFLFCITLSLSPFPCLTLSLIPLCLLLSFYPLHSLLVLPLFLNNHSSTLHYVFFTPFPFGFLFHQFLPSPIPSLHRHYLLLYPNSSFSVSSWAFAPSVLSNSPLLNNFLFIHPFPSNVFLPSFEPVSFCSLFLNVFFPLS